MFSASARGGGGGIVEDGIGDEEEEDVEEDVEEDGDEEMGVGDEDEEMGVGDEDVDGETGAGEDEDADEEMRVADDEDEGLFVSQTGDEPATGNGDGKQIPPMQTGDAESPSHADNPLESVEHSPSCHSHDAAEDEDYVDEEEKKAREDEKVQEMIDAAEAAAAPTEEGEKRSQLFVKGRSKRKDMTLNLVQHTKTSTDEIQQRIAALATRLPQPPSKAASNKSPDGLESADAEEKLSLKISKADFSKMRIVGQFNLGFVLAVREAAAETDEDDELFIIDQHASDEKYNFERLQATTTVQSQRLVQPKTLDLTALEEEIILEHLPALERNGFVAQVDTSGARPVGSRVQLLSLPLSRETTFSVADLEELVFLLADNPTSSATTIPRPSKVRKMFAMRACRSSIMIGKALSRRQMEKVVRHMGEMEKPWNCPHGRPTMRHLCGLGAWTEEAGFDEFGAATDWAGWAREKMGEE